MFPLLDILGPIVNKVLDFIPDPAKKAEAQLRLQQEINANEQAIMKAVLGADAAQIDVNKVEAGNPSLFVSGWRPFVGWTCGLGFAWATLVQPVLVFILAVFHHPMVTPQIQTEVLMQALLGLLGLGGFRMMEKKWGVASK